MCPFNTLSYSILKPLNHTQQPVIQPLSALSLPENAEIRAAKREEGILKDILLLQAEGLRQDLPKSLYETTDRQFQSCTIHAIPYFAWGNREQGDMCVWIREEP